MFYFHSGDNGTGKKISERLPVLSCTIRKHHDERFGLGLVCVKIVTIIGTIRAGGSRQGTKFIIGLPVQQENDMEEKLKILNRVWRIKVENISGKDKKPILSR